MADPFAAQPTPSGHGPHGLDKKKALEILTTFESELQSDIDQFKQASESVCEWEKNVYENFEHVSSALYEVGELQGYQEDLKGSFHSIEVDHSILKDNLDKLEQDVKKYKKSEGIDTSTPEAHSLQRSNMFSLAVTLMTQLQQMDEKLDAFNYDQGNIGAQSGSHVDTILDLLNKHNDALSWLEDNSKDLYDGIEKLANKAI